VFESRVLRRIFGPKRDAVTGIWRNLHNGEPHNLYTSPSIFRQIKSRRMRWAGHVAFLKWVLTELLTKLLPLTVPHSFCTAESQNKIFPHCP
jgi:hypothetical protein